MKNSATKRKLAETVVGAAIGAAIAGPAGAVAGALVGSQAAAHTPPSVDDQDAPNQEKYAADDPFIHAQLKRILVPLDFSQPSRRALRFACEWATRFGSEIVLLHVLEPVNTVTEFGTVPTAPPVPPVDYHQQARVELEKIASKEFPETLKVSVELRDGAAYDQIAVAARDLGADLIIIATHGRTGLTRALLGSTAERVVRHAPCPVLTLRRSTRD